jgi:RHS repeat-associated protein
VRVGCAGSNYPFLTQKERDIETVLDYFGARYYASTQGRFTSVDPGNYQAWLDTRDPQSWNAYSNVNNNPLARVDHDGRGFFSKLKNWLVYDVWGEEDDVKREENKRRETLLNKQTESGGVLVIQNLGGDLIQVDPAGMTRMQVFFWSNRLMDIYEQGGGDRPQRPDDIVHLGKSLSGRPAIEGDPYHPNSVDQRVRPEYRANPAHDPRSPSFNPLKTPEPPDAAAVYQSSVRAGMGTWFGKSPDGQIYRFFSDNAGGVHFSGVIPISQVPKDVLKLLGF